MDCLWYNGLGGEEKSGDVRWQAESMTSVLCNP